MKNEEHSFRRFQLSTFIPSSILQSMVLYAACPYMCYQVLLTHTAPLMALLLTLLFPLTGLALNFSQRRSPDMIAIGSLIAMIFVFASTFLENANKPLLLQILLPLGSISLVCLLSQWLKRPLFFYIDRYFMTVHNDAALHTYSDQWEHNSAYRIRILKLNLVWGCFLLGAALVLLLLYFTLSSAQFLPFAPLIPYTLYALLIFLTIWTINTKDTLTTTSIAQDSFDDK